MKRLLSKRSGFTLVEIIIAFAIFAIMASMIVQVLNLMVKRKVRNKQFEDNLSIQEEQFIARTKDMNYTATDPDGQLVFQFKDIDGSDLSVDPIDYQLKNWDPDNPRNLVNYFAGDYEYELAAEGTEHIGEEDPDSEDPDAATIGGSTQMSRFDTRITGTKGIKEIKVKVAPTSEANVVSVTVWIEDSGVEDLIKDHAQVTLFFAENKPNGKALKVTRVSKNGDSTSLSTIRSVKPSGENGVNIHTEAYSRFNNTDVTFDVEFDKDVDVADIGFGQGDNVNGSDLNSDSGIRYTPFTVTSTTTDGSIKTETYVNIFGAYQKGSSSTGGEPTDGEPTEE